MDALLKKASRNGRSGNMAVAAEQGRFQHVKSYTHMLNLTSLHLSECSVCTICQSYRGGADVLLNFAKEKTHGGTRCIQADEEVSAPAFPLLRWGEKRRLSPLHSVKQRSHVQDIIKAKERSNYSLVRTEHRHDLHLHPRRHMLDGRQILTRHSTQCINVYSVCLIILTPNWRWTESKKPLTSVISLWLSCLSTTCMYLFKKKKKKRHCKLKPSKWWLAARWNWCNCTH